MPGTSDDPDKLVDAQADVGRKKPRDHKDIVGGVASLVIAALFIVPSFKYGLGTPQRMGPGFFPFVLGTILAIIGIAILVPALKRPEVRPPIFWRPATAIFAGIAAFALIVEPFGLVPAVWATIVLTSLGDRHFKPRRVAALALVVSAAACLIFIYGLGVPIPMFKVP